MFDNLKGLFKKKLPESDLAHCYKKVFGSADGQTVLRDLMKFGHISEMTYVPSDPTHTAFNEGKRRVVLRVMSFVDAELIQNAINNGEE